jgi:aspartyl-tRNA(Asn)/glutamyl-tRNA(Gln) amidotransferase subunit C
MDVSREDVLRCAKLTDLYLEEEEIEPLREAMTQLLSHAESLNRLSLEDVPPTTHGLDLPMPRREDQALPSFTQAEALANAPEQDRGHFVVPKALARD